jgi:hypothetical protein
MFSEQYDCLNGFILIVPWGLGDGANILPSSLQCYSYLLIQRNLFYFIQAGYYSCFAWGSPRTSWTVLKNGH